MKLRHLILLALTPVFASGAPLLEKTSLVSTEWLSEHLAEPNLRIIDARPSLSSYIQGHLPGAIYLHTETLRISEGGVPAQLLPVDLLADLLGHLGIGDEHTVVVYSGAGDNFAHATYVVYVLNLLGHQSVGLLDGGWEKWEHEELESTTAFPAYERADFTANPDLSILKDARDVQQAADAGVTLLDARRPDLFAAGHIPTAESFFLADTLAGSEPKVWKTKEELREMALQAGVSPEESLITYCTSGRMSSQIWFGLRHVAGFEGVASYEGSLIDWNARALPLASESSP